MTVAPDPGTPHSAPRTPLSADRRRSQRFANIYLTFSAAALTALIVVVVILVISNSNLQAAQHQQSLNAIAAARQNSINACEQANANRTEDITIWGDVLKLPSGAPAAQVTAVARDLALVHKAYALRDCAALYPAAPK